LFADIVLVSPERKLANVFINQDHFKNFFDDFFFVNFLYK